MTTRIRTIPNKPIPHGTKNGYNNYRCRCRDCRRAWSAYYSQFVTIPCPNCGTPILGRYRPGAMCRACRAIAKTIPLDERHGTETGYSKGCRCDSCRTASNEARRNRPARRSGGDAAYLRNRRQAQRLTNVR